MYFASLMVCEICIVWFSKLLLKYVAFTDLVTVRVGYHYK